MAVGKPVDMSTTGVVVLVVVLVLAAVAAAVLVMRRQRERDALRERFGQEYDRAVDEHGDRRTAEKKLADVAEQHDKLTVRELAPAERDRYTRLWMEVQAAFVDDPVAATRDADRLVEAVMRDRGYPVEDFETQAHMIAVDHPDVVSHYRAAHAVGLRSDEASTEELRQAFVHYRELFEEMLSEPREDPTYP